MGKRTNKALTAMLRGNPNLPKTVVREKFGKHSCKQARNWFSKKIGSKIKIIEAAYRFYLPHGAALNVLQTIKSVYVPIKII